MNNLEYLNEISKSNRPVAAPVKGVSVSLIIKIVIGSLLVIGIIVGMSILMSNSAARSNDLTKQIYYRTNELNSSVTEYNRKLKSSNLRAIGLTLSGTLSASSNQLQLYFKERGIKADLKPELLAPETQHFQEFNTALLHARLNGILDRIYVNQVQLQVALILSLISQDYERTKNENLQNILTQYHHNLMEIYNDLQNYSNPSD